MCVCDDDDDGSWQKQNINTRINENKEEKRIKCTK